MLGKNLNISVVSKPSSYIIKPLKTDLSLEKSHMKIYPSLISADLLNLATVIKLLEPHCDGFHLDVMDNHFVPNLTWGPAFINAIATVAKKTAHVHLMIDNPAAMLDRFTLPKDTIIAFHGQSTQNPRELIKKITLKGWVASIALSPALGIETIAELLPEVGEVLVMSVEPGFSGQKFMPAALEKAAWLAEYRQQKSLDFTIVMDGGINAENIGQVRKAGVDGVAVAAGIFGTPDPIKALNTLKMTV